MKTLTKKRKLFVANIAAAASKFELVELFELVTIHPVSCKMVFRKPMKKFAFVTFRTEEDTEVAIQLHGYRFQNRDLVVRAFMPPRPRP